MHRSGRVPRIHPLLHIWHLGDIPDSNWLVTENHLRYPLSFRTQALPFLAADFIKQGGALEVWVKKRKGNGMATRDEELLVRQGFEYGLAILINNKVPIPYGQSSWSQWILFQAEPVRSRAPLWVGTLLLISVAQPGSGCIWQWRLTKGSAVDYTSITNISAWCRRMHERLRLLHKVMQRHKNQQTRMFQCPLSQECLVLVATLLRRP